LIPPSAQIAPGTQLGPYCIEARLKELSVHEYVVPYNFAVIYAGLGDKDEAFVWLNRAIRSDLIY